MAKNRLIYADIHVGTVVGKLNESTGLDYRVEDALKIERIITDYCMKNDITEVWFLGDRTKSRNTPTWLIDLIDVEWLRRVNLGITMRVLVGNHDVYRLVSQGNSYSSLWSGFHSCIIMSKPTVLTSATGVKIGFLPFGSSPDSVETVDVLCFHDEIQGFMDDRGYKAPEGTHFSTGLRLEDLERKCRTLLLGGHIHSRVPFGSKGQYIGSPYQIDEMDIGSERGFYILDLETLAFNFVKIPAPELVKHVVNDARKHDFSNVAGNYVTVFVRVGQEEVVQQKCADAKVLKIHTMKEKGMMIESVARGVFKAGDSVSAIKEYVLSRDLPDRDALLKAGLELFSKSKEM